MSALNDTMKGKGHVNQCQAQLHHKKSTVQKFQRPSFWSKTTTKKVAPPNILLDYWCQQNTSLLASCTLE
jgi:hypothetical protein